MIAKDLTIKDRYNHRKLKFDDVMDLRKKKQPNLHKLLSAKSEVPTPYSIIKYGLKSEVSAQTMERDNTLIFMCDVQSTKPMIKKALEELYGAKIMKINTLNTFKKFAKKAFVRFAQEGDAVEVASKAGIL